MRFSTILYFAISTIASATVYANNSETFIVNGDDATNVPPFYAYLEIFREPDFGGVNKYAGGGTLISLSHILTVAQNIFGFQSWRIGLGATHISDMLWHNSSQAHIHPLYNSSSLAHNLAVLRLTQSASLTDRITPIPMLPAESTFPTVWTNVQVAGFGFGVNERQPRVLQKSQLFVIGQSECGASYPHLIRTNQIAAHFCAVNPNTESNICGGDQGGPVYVESLNILVGIQSFIRVAGCGHEQAQPPAFIRVALYVTWIKGVL